jgi:Ca2+/H+ antiporter, TMEM165/GDT1 family
LQPSFEAFSVSTGVVALGEVGDKTQLLALLLAARYRSPAAIIAGILVATLANHAAAAGLGAWLGHAIDPAWLRWGLGSCFLGVALWMLVPDEAQDAALDGQGTGRWGVFGVTVLTFFLAEMGDKTQVATVMLAARYHDVPPVLAGTTLGMLIADVPAVLLGQQVLRHVPVRWIHRVAALAFAAIGAAILLGLQA